MSSKRKVLFGVAFLFLFIMPFLAWGQALTHVEIQQQISVRGARWHAGETSMSRLSAHEQQKRLGLIRPVRTGSEPMLSLQAAPPVGLPPTMDWRNNGGNYVTPIRNQGGCGSCWAFASTAALESNILIYNQTPGVNLDLSEQVLVSCGNAGSCGGGSIGYAADFFKNTGLPLESCYPYTGTDGTCSSACANWASSVYQIASWQYVATSEPNVDAIRTALRQYGPLVTTMAVYQDFFSYSSGIYSYVSGTLAGYHAVLIVGYDDVGQYFIVKNSWDTWWGESGYFRIAYSELNSVVQFGDWTIAYVGKAPGCSYSASQPGTFPAAGANGTIAVTTTAECSWSATSTVPWITITAGSSGKGNGTVSFTVSKNTDVARAGTLTVAGRSISISQDAAPLTCTYQLNPTQVTIDSSASSRSVSVTAGSGCSWTAATNASWIRISSGSSGSGNGTVLYSVDANTGSARTGTLTIAGYTFTVYQGGITCTLSITPTSQSFGADSGVGTVNVTAASGCNWTAASNASWITVTSGTSGSGSGRATYSVAANTGAARTGTLTIAGNTFTVTQAGSAICPVNLSAWAVNLGYGPRQFTVRVSASSDCSWTASANAAWISFASGASGTGNGEVVFNVETNNGAARTGTITIGSSTVTVNQAGNTTCTYTLTPTSQSFSTAAGSGSVTVSSASSCNWTAASNAGWISVTSGTSGSGNGTVGYSVAANTGAARTGTLTIAGSTFTVSQAAASCTYTLNPSSQSFSAVAGTGSVSVSSATGCSWTAASNVSWITVTSGTSGSGNGTVGYSVAANTGAARTGTLTIAGSTFTVNQAAGSCTYSIAPSSQSLSAVAGTGSVSVSSATGCSWTAASNAGWISVTSGTSGSGNGTVGYSVAANTGAARTGTLTIAGNTFTVNQAAASTCSVSLSAWGLNLGYGARQAFVRVSASDDCSWTATTNVSWISFVSGASGTGRGEVDFAVETNNGAARTGTITINDSSLIVNQAGNSTCTYTLTPTSQSFSTAAGSGSVSVSAATGCSWTAASNAGWISVTSGTSGSGNGTVGYSVAANTGAARTGTLTIAGNAFTVTQAGTTACTYAVSPESFSAGSSSGSGSVTVSTTSTCLWSASSGSPWLTITSGSTGQGNGTVSFAYSANTDVARTGTLTVAGRNVSITQPGTSPSCAYFWPTEHTFNASMSIRRFSLTADSSCSWTVVSNTPWIKILSGSSGTGNGMVSYSVDENTNGSSRTGTVNVGGKTLTVIQGGTLSVRGR